MMIIPRVALFASALLMGSPALATPSITLSPISTHPDGATKVSGTGFGPSEAVDVYLDTTDVVLAFTDSSGNFGPYKLPVSATTLPGSHYVTALGRKDGDGSQKALLVSTTWASHGFDARGRRTNPCENQINASNIGKLDVAWSYLTGNFLPSSPAVAEIGVTNYVADVFVGSVDGKLYALDSVTGALKWSATAGTNIYSSPAVAAGNVYVGSGDGKIYAFKASTGAPAWPAPAATGGFVASSPTVANGIVYVGSTDGKLYALKASDGTAAWASPASAGGNIDQSVPAVADGVVYVGSFGDGKLYAFDAATGASMPGFPVATGSLIKSSPAVAYGIVYIGSEDTKLYAFNAKTGAQIWTTASADYFDSSPAVANRVVYAGSYDHRLFAFDARTGAQLWVGQTGDQIESSPAIANGVVYVASKDGYVYAFNANGCGASVCPAIWTGAAGGAFLTIGESWSSPAVSDGMVFVGWPDKRLYAFALNGGYNSGYAQRNAPPPPYATLHPDLRLSPITRTLKAN